jgi:WD40 repeat protein
VLLDLRSPQPVRRPLEPGIGRISAVAFSPDGKRLAVGGEHAPAPVLIDIASGRVAHRMTGGGHRDGIISMRFDPTGSRLATGGTHDLQAIVWDTATGRPIRQLKQPTTNEQQEVSVAWSPDGSALATAGGGGRVILWRTSTWQQTATWAADTSLVLCVAFSPDGSMIAVGGVGDRSVTLWDVAGRKLVGRLPHPMFLASVAFDPAGRTLATSAFDDKVRLWDLASLRQIGPALPGAENGSGTNASAFDPSGNYLIALHDSGTAFVWNLDPERWKQQACAVVGRSLTREEWRELLPDRGYQPACR